LEKKEKKEGGRRKKKQFTLPIRIQFHKKEYIYKYIFTKVILSIFLRLI